MTEPTTKQAKSNQRDPGNGVLLYVAVSGLGAGVFAPEFAYVARVTAPCHRPLWSNYEPGPALDRRPDTSEKNGQAALYDAILAALNSDSIPSGSTVRLIEKDRGAELVWVFGELRPSRHRDAKGKERKNAVAIKCVEGVIAQKGLTLVACVAETNEELEGVYLTREAARHAMEDCREWREKDRD